MNPLAFFWLVLCCWPTKKHPKPWVTVSESKLNHIAGPATQMGVFYVGFSFKPTRKLVPSKNDTTWPCCKLGEVFQGTWRRSRGRRTRGCTPLPSVHQDCCQMMFHILPTLKRKIWVCVKQRFLSKWSCPLSPFGVLLNPPLRQPNVKAGNHDI